VGWNYDVMMKFGLRGDKGMIKNFWCLECWKPYSEESRHICVVGLCGNDGQHFGWCPKCYKKLREELSFMFNFSFKREVFKNNPRLVIN